MTVGTTCAHCGTGLREHARFCDACGAPFTSSGDAAEYKQVTVLFADVVQSMKIAAALDIERLHEIMTDLVTRSSAVVRHYGGTVEFIGDGVMAIFGAPIALEDHASRACLAALSIQDEARQLACEVRRRDGVDLSVRVGLNSGRVIAGDLGTGALGYRAIGEQVGLAQRMESVAPPGGIMLSESTARLVEHIAVLADPKWMHIKGADDAVRVRPLIAIDSRHGRIRRRDPRLVGREREIAEIGNVLARAAGGRAGELIGLMGSPGIGKSRVAREAAALARAGAVNVCWAFCESHAGDIPFHVVSQLLRMHSGVTDLDNRAGRLQVRARMPLADPEDLLLFEDLLGIADPDVPLPQIDPDARRRRLTALITSSARTSAEPALYIIEDAQWIDEVSESMLADFFAVVPRTPSVALVTYRPEYRGKLAPVASGRTIVLDPLCDSEITALLRDLLGTHTSVSAITTAIVTRAAGNAFFAEEMVRELEQRGTLVGERGAFICRSSATAAEVPATVQATISARIDRLDVHAKRTLHAASVIGGRFDAQLLHTLEDAPELVKLLDAELIEHVESACRDEYAFRHPLIRAVAYESQLRSDRVDLHRRLAVALESRCPGSTDQNAALIAEHLEAAGDRPAAYAWQMRAAAWSTHRDIAASRVGWERASQIADALPVDHPGRLQMRIAARMMLCAAGWRVDAHIANRFQELRDLCSRAGDKASLALGMTGMVMDHMMNARVHEAADLASEQMTLLDAIGDPALTAEAGLMAILLKYRAGEIADVLRWSQAVIDWTGGDPAKGNLVIGSPLAMALVWRGVARFWLGRDGWRSDLERAVDLAQTSDPATRVLVIFWKHGWTITNGVLLADETVLRELDEALLTAQRLGDDTALGLAKYVLGMALSQQVEPSEKERGARLLAEVRDMCDQHRFYRSELPGLDVADAVQSARHGDLDGAISVIRRVLDGFFETGQLAYGAAGTAFLVEALLTRGGESDVAEAKRAIDRAAELPPHDGLVLRDLWLLRLRALLARAHKDEDEYRDLANRYRTMAKSLGFEGHIVVAETM